jgi:probable rRNA maturation factor
MILNRQRSERVVLQRLEPFTDRVCKALGLRKADVTICLVSDAEIARMNEAFRKKRGATDVLSFPAVDRKRPVRLARNFSSRRATQRSLRYDRTGPATYIGDIAISPATARRNARKDGRSLETELRILILHGMLHLLGFDHETDQGEMSRMEERLRRRFKLA